VESRPGFAGRRSVEPIHHGIGAAGNAHNYRCLRGHDASHRRSPGTRRRFRSNRRERPAAIATAVAWGCTLRCTRGRCMAAPGRSHAVTSAAQARISSRATRIGDAVSSLTGNPVAAEGRVRLRLSRLQDVCSVETPWHETRAAPLGPALRKRRPARGGDRAIPSFALISAIAGNANFHAPAGVDLPASALQTRSCPPRSTGRAQIGSSYAVVTPPPSLRVSTRRARSRRARLPPATSTTHPWRLAMYRIPVRIAAPRLVGDTGSPCANRHLRQFFVDAVGTANVRSD